MLLYVQCSMYVQRLNNDMLNNDLIEQCSDEFWPLYFDRF